MRRDHLRRFTSLDSEVRIGAWVSVPAGGEEARRLANALRDVAMQVETGATKLPPSGEPAPKVKAKKTRGKVS